MPEPALDACPPLAVPPRRLPLAHPTPSARLPAGSGWLYELKWDGIRVLCVRAAGRVELIGRSGAAVTARYPEIAAAVAALPGGDVALDGEIVALDTAGRPRFAWLAERAHLASARAAETAARRRPLTCYAFDCLAADGRDVRGLPLVARKALCRARVAAGGERLRFCDHVDRDGAAFLQAVCAAGLEGVVAKRAASAYPRGRSREWLKIKCTREETFVVGGWTDPAGTRRHLGALHLGERRGRRLVYVGKVGSGLGEAGLAALAARLRALATARCPFTEGDPPRGPAHHWAAPRLACRVRYVERTDDGRLRHPVFLGLAEAAAVRPRGRSATRRPPARRR